MASYHPLGQVGGYSPSLRPSISQDPDDIANNDRLDLDGYGGGSRGPSPEREALQPTDYDSYRQNRYNQPPDDIENQHLIKDEALQPPEQFRLYKRRWFGLVQLSLLSFTIGWGYTAPSVVADTAREWYDITFPQLNTLGIASSLVFIVPAPFTIWILNKFGPKWSIVISSVLVVIGSWVMYAGAATHNFDVNIAGTVIHSLAMPFTLCAPTRYSRQWFGDSGRTLATAIPSLAYPLGSGFGALTGPYMVKPVGPLNYDMQNLIIAVIFTTIAIPVFFLPNQPPTPPSHVASVRRLNLKQSITSLLRNPAFYLQFIAFSMFAGALEAATGITIQAITPYGYSQQEGSYAIAFLIFVGIGAALVVSPILDKTKWHVGAMKVFVVIVAITYTAMPWVPESQSTAALYAAYAVIGAFSISLEPCVLEFQASQTHPVSPEFSSVLCWCGAKVMTAVFTIVAGDVLLLKKPKEGQPRGSLFNGFLFIAGMAWLAAACVMLTNVWIFKRTDASKVKGT